MSEPVSGWVAMEMMMRDPSQRMVFNNRTYRIIEGELHHFASWYQQWVPSELSVSSLVLPRWFAVAAEQEEVA